MHEFEGSRLEFMKILAEMGEEPSFLARAQAHAQALELLLKSCEERRAELLVWPRRRFTALRRRVRDDWDRLRGFVQEVDASSIFIALGSQLPELAPQGQPLFATDRGLLKAFLDSAGRFNHQWDKHLQKSGVDGVNKLREAYNQFYSIEKEAAFGTDRVNDDFVPLPMLEASFLRDRFPLLKLPTLR